MNFLSTLYGRFLKKFSHKQYCIFLAKKCRIRIETGDHMELNEGYFDLSHVSTNKINLYLNYKTAKEMYKNGKPNKV